MEDNNTIQITDAYVILTIYKDYKNLSERYKALEEEKNGYRDAVVRVAAMIDQEEIRKAESDYHDRHDIERTFFDAKEIRKAIGLPEGICEEADRILREREEANHEDEESKSDGE